MTMPTLSPFISIPHQWTGFSIPHGSSPVEGLNCVLADGAFMTWVRLVVTLVSTKKICLGYWHPRWRMTYRKIVQAICYRLGVWDV